MYKDLKRSLEKEIKNYQKLCIHRRLLSCKNDIKSLWKNINQITPFKRKSSNIPVEIKNVASANKFNNYFCTIGESVFKEVNKSGNILNTVGQKLHDYPQFDIHEVTTREVLETVKSLKDSNSTGIDNIKTSFIKDSVDSLLTIITFLVNYSIKTRKVPQLWKTAIVIPIYKNVGSKTDPSNYRPISLLPILSKILEKIVARQLICHMERYKIINEKQFGFRLKSSTNTALSYVCENIYNSLDKNKISLLILLDLSKAFDSISHQMLFEALRAYNIYHEWFHDYLNNRLQKTKIADVYSDVSKISYGVPQGSILGPILFTIFVNELETLIRDFKHANVKVDFVTYADDTQLIFNSEFKDYNNLIQHASLVTNKVINWFTSLRLKINIKKTQCMLMCTKTQSNKIDKSLKYIILNDTRIDFVDSVVNLGIAIDYNMKFKTHINNLYKKIFSTLLYINKTRKYHSFLTRKLITEQLALSHLNYCRNIWSACNKAQKTQIQRLINFGSKIIFDLGKHDRATECINKLHWLNAENSFKFSIGCEMYKTVNNLLNNNVTHTIQLTDKIQTRSNKTIYKIPNYFNKYGENTLTVRSIRFWNLLPDYIQEAKSLNVFKKQLSNYLLNNEQLNVN